MFYSIFYEEKEDEEHEKYKEHKKEYN